MLKKISRARKKIHREINNPNFNPERTLESIVAAFNEIAHEKEAGTPEGDTNVRRSKGNIKA
jgi:hypothetical protein